MTDVTGTAYWIAAARAKESARPDRLFEDPYAARLAGERGRELLALSGGDRGDNRYLPVRTRYFDDVLVDWAGRYPDGQVVLLGAGLDTRAYRLGLPEGVRVFEIDRAPVLEAKAAVVSGRTVPVPADLAGDWTGALEAAGYDPAVPVLWLAEGLLFYLPGAGVEALLAQTAHRSVPGSVFAADVFGTGLRRLGSLPEAVRERAFCTDEPAALFGAAGWTRVTLTHPGSPEANYGRIPAAYAGPADPTMRTYLVVARA